MPRSKLNLFFPQRNTQVWLCVVSTNAYSSPHRDALVSGRIRKGQRVFEAKRSQKLDRLWIGFRPKPRAATGSTSGTSNIQLQWVPTSTVDWMPILRKAEDYATDARHVFDLDRRLSIAVVGGDETSRARTRARTRSRTRTASGPVCLDHFEEVMTKPAASDEVATPPLHAQEVDAIVKVGAYTARSICHELNAMVKAIVVQAQDIVISQSHVPHHANAHASAKASTQRSHTIRNNHDDWNDTNAHLNTIDSANASRRAVSVGTLWAHMDIINAMHHCCPRESAAAFSEYVTAGCDSGAPLALSVADLNEWVTHYFRADAHLASCIAPLQEFLKHELEARRSHAPTQYGCCSVLAVLENMSATGQTLLHQRFFWKSFSQSSKHAVGNSRGDTGRTGVSGHPLKKWLGAAATAISSLLRGNKQARTIGVDDAVSVEAARSLHTLTKLIHKIYSLPQFRQHRIWHARTVLHMVHMSSRSLRLLPHLTQLVGGEKAFKELWESSQTPTTSPATSRCTSPNVSRKSVRNDRAFVTPPGSPRSRADCTASSPQSAKVSKTVLSFMDGKQRTKVGPILKVYVEELDSYVSALSLQMRQCKYLESVLCRQNVYFKQVLGRILAGFDGLNELVERVEQRFAVHTSLLQLTKAALQLAAECLRRRHVVIDTLMRSLDDDGILVAPQRQRPRTHKQRDMLLLQALQYCSKPQYVLAQDSVVMDAIKRWDDIQTQLVTVDGHIDVCIAAAQQHVSTTISAFRRQVYEASHKAAEGMILREAGVHAVTAGAGASSTSTAVRTTGPWADHVLQPSSVYLSNVCSSSFLSCGALANNILLPEVRKRIRKIARDDSVLHLTGPVQAELNIGVPARPAGGAALHHLLQFGSTRASSGTDSIATTNTGARSASDNACRASDNEQTIAALAPAELSERHDTAVTNVLRLVRRCAACVAQELFWIFSGQTTTAADEAILKHLNTTKESFANVQRCAVYLQSEYFFWSQLYSEVVATFDPHPCLFCDVLPPFANHYDPSGASFAAVEQHLVVQTQRIASKHTLSCVGVCDKVAAAVFNCDSAQALISVAISCSSFSQSRSTLASLLRSRGDILMNEALISLLKAIVADITVARGSKKEPRSAVGSEDMFPALIFILVTSDAATVRHLVRWGQFLSCADSAHSIDAQEMGLESSDTHGHASYAQATLHAAIRWILDFNRQIPDANSSVANNSRVVGS